MANDERARAADVPPTDDYAAAARRLSDFLANPSDDEAAIAQALADMTVVRRHLQDDGSEAAS